MRLAIIAIRASKAAGWDVDVQRVYSLRDELKRRSVFAGSASEDQIRELLKAEDGSSRTVRQGETILRSAGFTVAGERISRIIKEDGFSV